jgi:hypothetical protein
VDWSVFPTWSAWATRWAATCRPRCRCRPSGTARSPWATWPATPAACGAPQGHAAPVAGQPAQPLRGPLGRGAVRQPGSDQAAAPAGRACQVLQLGRRPARRGDGSRGRATLRDPGTPADLPAAGHARAPSSPHPTSSEPGWAAAAPAGDGRWPRSSCPRWPASGRCAPQRPTCCACCGPPSTLLAPRWPLSLNAPSFPAPGGQAPGGRAWLHDCPPRVAGPLLWHNGGTSGFRSFVAPRGRPAPPRSCSATPPARPTGSACASRHCLAQPANGRGSLIEEIGFRRRRGLARYSAPCEGRSRGPG